MKPTAPAFVTATISMASSLRKLNSWLDEAEALGLVFEGSSRATKDHLIQTLRAVMAAYWDRQASPTPSRHASKEARRSSLCTITAAECNAWLETLPPTPFAGDQ